MSERTYLPNEARAYLDGYNAAKAEPAWIRCSERLPEQVNKRLWSRDVLATIKQKTGNRFVVVAYYHYGCEQWKMDDMMDGDIIDVLAWQPLPAPYQGEK